MLGLVEAFDGHHKQFRGLTKQNLPLKIKTVK
jgi:hypothetical protein